MRNMLSQRCCAETLPRISLNAMWYVDADRTYNVSRRGKQGENYVAARTLSGAGTMELHDGRSFVLDANSVMLLHNRAIRRYAARDEKWQFYWFEFSSDKWPAAWLCQVDHIRASTQERVELDRCFKSLSRADPTEFMLAESLFAYLLADWHVRSTQNSETGTEVIELLETGRRLKLSIPEMARRAGMCERSFRTAVQNATGMSPKTYMLKGEMTAAMELLRTTDMSVSEIAASLDYKSPFYFSRVFKNYYGIAPQHVKDEMML